MLKFEDTRLLKHPTVKKAFAEMRKFFQDGDDFVAEAVRVGEIISQHAQNPDPDAIAACVLLDGMVISYKAESFAKTVSPGAAACLEKLYNFNPENPQLETVGEQQAFLGHSIKGLQEVYAEVTKPDFKGYTYRNINNIIERNEKSLNAVMQGTTETVMLDMALEKLAQSKDALAEVVRKYQAANEFEKSGLPEHPTVRGVYNHMRDWDIQTHPINSYTETNAGIAKVIVETGASSDPDVIGAALLNQYHDTNPGELTERFSQRLFDLVQETSPWYNFSAGKKTAPQTPEGNIIRAAALTYFMEERVASFQSLKAQELSAHMLQDMEHLRDRLAESEKHQSSVPLRQRMAAVIAATDKFMHKPAQMKIRKPGSPDIEPGW